MISTLSKFVSNEDGTPVEADSEELSVLNNDNPLTIKFSVKGSSRSGNYMHAGIPGHVGGSQPKSFKYPVMSGISPVPSDKVTIAGKTGAEWAKQQQIITAAGSDNLTSELQGNSAVAQSDVDDYLDRLNTHRGIVLDETLRVAQHYHLTGVEQHELVSNLLGHDVDKYTAKQAIPYINRHNDRDAFWEGVAGHHDNNSHHPQYWETGKDRAEQMPTVSMIEMVGDWIATAKYFKTPKDEHYRTNGHDMILHPETRAAAERELGIKRTPFPDLFPDDFFKHRKEMTIQFRYKGSAKSGNYAHAGRQGKVGGSAPKSTTTLSPTTIYDLNMALQALPKWAPVTVNDKVSGKVRQLTAQNTRDLVMNSDRATLFTDYAFTLPVYDGVPKRDEAPMVVAPYSNLESMPFYKPEDRTEGAIRQNDPYTMEIFKAQGFDGKPDVVNLQQLQQYAASGEPLLYRGVGRGSEQFRTGDLFIGTGNYGVGTYTAKDDVHTAISFRGSKLNEGGAVMVMTLRKDAKVITSRDLAKTIQKESNDIMEKTDARIDAIFEMSGRGDVSREQVRALRQQARDQARAISDRPDMRDEGRYAASHGYDAIFDEGSQYYIVLNRTAVRVLNRDNIDIDGSDI